VNNALNGALVNLEVVKARARPGADAGLVAAFAAAAGEQMELTATLAGALVSLARAPRGGADPARDLRDAVTLLAPAAAHDGVRLEVEGARTIAAGGDPLATRLAVVRALLAVAAAASTVEIAGAVPAHGAPRAVRCTIRDDDAGPSLELTPSFGAVLPDAVHRALARAGVRVQAGSEILRLALPAHDAP